MSMGEDILRKCVKSLPPALTETKHKGEAGRIGIIGGSSEYTGAPYYAGITALKCGADLAYIFCTKDAAIPIKSYSPELIVLPYLDAEHGPDLIASRLPNIHSLVIGPGLGVNAAIHAQVAAVINSIKVNSLQPKIPLVFDADGLGLLADNKEILKDYEGPVYLTPNANEIKKLAYAYCGRKEIDTEDETTLKSLRSAINPNATLILKGQRDKIVTSSDVHVCSVVGSMRRCGGQGDVLSGSLGVFSYWAALYTDKKGERNSISASVTTATAAYAACSFTRICSRLAFEEHERATTTTDMIGKIQKAYKCCFG